MHIFQIKLCRYDPILHEQPKRRKRTIHELEENNNKKQKHREVI